MRRLVPLALCLTLVSTPVFAQRMGQSNRNAPTIEQTIRFDEGTAFSVSYTAITWARGETMEAVMSEEGDRARERINTMAERAPLGTLQTTRAFELGGKSVPAGEYDLMFTIDEQRKWHLVAASKGDGPRLDWTLDLQSTGHQTKRLSINVMAADEDDRGRLRIAFGDMSTMVDLRPHEGETGNQ